jgi:cell division protein FtsB
MKSLEKFLIVFSLVHAASTAMHTIEGALHPESANQEMESAAEEAERAVRRIDVLDDEARVIAADAARKDYELLVSIYGKDDRVLIGEPVLCFRTMG